MNNLKKAGRLAFLLPYIVMPFLVMLLYHEDLDVGMLFAYFMPMGIESPVIILYPVCWIITIVSFILCAKENKRNNDKKGKLVNRLILLFAVIWTVVHIIACVHFIANFSIEF